MENHTSIKLDEKLEHVQEFRVYGLRVGSCVQQRSSICHFREEAFQAKEWHQLLAEESTWKRRKRGLTYKRAMDSPPPPRSEYELLRDRNVVEVRKMAAACEVAAREW